MIVSQKKVKMSSPEQVYKIIRSILDSQNIEENQEHFYVIGLNSKNVIQYIDLISIGTVNESLVHPRDVFRTAIQRNCAAIVICHNHPSGEANPSSEDIHTTKRLKSSSNILGIPLIDHVIVAGKNYFSFEENSYLK